MAETVVLAPASYIVDPDLGSDPERPWRLIQGLIRRGVRVVAVARKIARAHELGEGVTVRLLPGEIPSSATGRVIDRIRLYLYARAVALNELKGGSVLVVHHFGPCARQSPSLLSRLPVPFVYGPMPGVTPRRGLSRGDWAYWLGLPETSRYRALASFGLSKLAAPGAHFLWRRTIARADAVTVEAAYNIPFERPDSIVIPPGIDTSHFTPDGGSPVPGRIVAVGVLIWRKGFDVLIRAVAAAVREAPTVHALIVGDGPQEAELARLAADLGIGSQIQFLGRVNRRDLPALYRSSMVACHPARLDTFPLAPIEAMACGVPVLVSDTGALPEMVGEAGLVHHLGEVDELAHQLTMLVRDDATRRAMGHVARERALVRYSVQAMADAHLALYHKLAAGSALGGMRR
jgi:glycosyltransferase involved in cell wall biosynthesis